MSGDLREVCFAPSSCIPFCPMSQGAVNMARKACLALLIQPELVHSSGLKATSANAFKKWSYLRSGNTGCLKQGLDIHIQLHSVTHCNSSAVTVKSVVTVNPCNVNTLVNICHGDCLGKSLSLIVPYFSWIYDPDFWHLYSTNAKQKKNIQNYKKQNRKLNVWMKS